MAWQINESCFLWGSHVDRLLHENANSFDKKGNNQPKHDIAAVLGLKPAGGFNLAAADIEKLEVRPFNPEDWESKVPVKTPDADGWEPDESAMVEVMVDSPSDTVWTSRKRYATTEDMLNWQQRGRGKSRIVRPDEVSGPVFSTMGTGEPVATDKSGVDPEP